MRYGKAVVQIVNGKLVVDITDCQAKYFNLNGCKIITNLCISANR
jgi:hypothetical protein